MCEQCLYAAQWHFPELPEDEIGELLMGATAYPFCSPIYLDKQLEEMREAGVRTLNQALAYADMKMEEEYQRYKIETPSEEDK